MPQPPSPPPLPLLLLPGLMNDERVWAPVAEAFGPGRHVVITPTHDASHVDALAAQALARLPPGRFALAGFSLGGYVAQAVCRQAPGRIAGLALLCTGARAESDEGRAVRQRLIAGARAASADFDQLAAAFLPRVVHPSRVADPDLQAVLLDMARTVGREGFARQQQAALDRPDSRPTLAAIDTATCPVLVLCGRDDQVAPLALGEEMAAALPGARLVVLPDCGHMATLEQPQAVTKAMAEWLAQVDAANTPP